MPEPIDSILKKSNSKISSGTIYEDIVQTAKNLESAALRGSAEAAFLLGRHHYLSHGIDIDFESVGKISSYKLGAFWLATAAKMGSLDASFLLAQHYPAVVEQEFGQTAEKHLKALFISQKSCKNPDAKTLYRIGFWLEFGAGCEVNQKLATEYFLKAAESGNPDAMIAVADEILDKALDKDLDEETLATAEKWCKKAFELGQRDALMMISTIELLRSRLTNKANATDYISRVERLAKEACARNDFRPIFWLSHHILSQKDDVSKAAELLEFGGKSGSAACYHSLGEIIRDQRLEGFNDNDALMYFGLAAEMGLPDAALEVAKMFEKGKGVSPSTVVADEYFGKADVENHVAEANPFLELLAPSTEEFVKQFDEFLDRNDEKLSSGDDDDSEITEEERRLEEFADAIATENERAMMKWLEVNSALFAHPAWNDYQWLINRVLKKDNKVGIEMCKLGAARRRDLKKVIETGDARLLDAMLQATDCVNWCDSYEVSPIAQAIDLTDSVSVLPNPFLEIIEILKDHGAFHNAASLGTCPYGFSLEDIEVALEDNVNSAEQMDRVRSGSLWLINEATRFATHPVSHESGWHFNPDILTWERSDAEIASFRGAFPSLFYVFKEHEDLFSYCRYQQTSYLNGSNEFSMSFECDFEFKEMIQWSTSLISSKYKNRINESDLMDLDFDEEHIQISSRGKKFDLEVNFWQPDKTTGSFTRIEVSTND